MGTSKSKNLVYTFGVPNSEEIQFSPVLRHPDSNSIRITPTVWGCTNYYSLFQKIAAKHPSRSFIGHRWNENSDFEWVTYAKTSKIVSILSTNLAYLELKQDDFLTQEYKKYKSLLGFLSKNRIEWIFTEIACISTNIVTVGLLDRLENFEIHCKTLNLKYLFTTSEFISQIIALKNQEKISIELVITPDRFPPEIIQACNLASIKVIFFEDLLEGEARSEENFITPNDPFCISLTSGTTGPAKYCLITHLNIMSNLSSCLYLSSEISTEDSYLSYLNFSLLGEKLFIFMISASGGKIGLALNPMDFKKDLKFLKPTLIISVPRMLEFLHSNIKKEVDSLTGLSKSLYAKAYSSKLKQYDKTGTLRHKVWDTIVFKKARKMMGGNLKVMVVGSGMCNKEVVRYLRIVLGCYILEGYGLIEASACSFCTLPYDTSCGNVGGPVMGLEIRLRYTGLVLENFTHYYGELCLRGDQVSEKYYGSHEKSIDQNGWLRTGDLFAMVPETGALKFIDRLEYLGKNKSGKTICVQKLEILYRQCSMIAQITVVFDLRIDGVIALVVPDKAYVTNKWKGEEFLAIARSNDFISALMREFLVLERIYKLKEHEKILKVWVETEPWVSAELVTPTLKPKRKIIIEKYRAQIEEMINSIVLET